MYEEITVIRIDMENNRNEVRPTLLFSASTLLFSASKLLISATILLFSALALLISAMHSCSVLWYSCNVLYCTVPTGTYCTVYLLFILIGLCRQTFI